MKLQEAFRKVIENVNNGQRYDWYDVTSCNCGLLAQVILDRDCSQLGEMIEKDGILDCSYLASIENCQVSGLSMHSIIQALLDAGLSEKDLCEFEKLANPIIRKRAGLSLDTVSIIDYSLGGRELIVPCDFDNSNSLVAYLSAWIDLLDEQEEIDRLTKMEVAEMGVMGKPLFKGK